MNTKPRVIPVVLATVLLAFAGCATSPHATAAWEYRVIQSVTHTPEFEEKLNKAGSEGFTIDSTTFIRGDEHTQHQLLVILKRVKR